ncbi:hypothetical protein [Pseudalkalibacillus hwajinpoensis]|uniref:hypothetical protein n=1 Tax=Guptibacillus hwajinpoensis TaxID=208199 RepID=UPI001CD798BE|nr:hypothetical protein [Pseudalkalibacillus hwajinpoensis]MCA0993404.1 hypothetical protein [Pseudalkalibacillus hwajinpoensis]
MGRIIVSLMAIFLLLLTGCSEKELSYTEINIKDAKENVKTFIDETEDLNGTHLYYENDQVVYVFVNGINVIQGDEAIYFEDFNLNADEESDALEVSYTQKKTEDYSNKELNHQLLYKVVLDKKYETLNAFQNGEAVTFGSVMSSD